MIHKITLSVTHMHVHIHTYTKHIDAHETESKGHTLCMHKCRQMNSHTSAYAICMFMHANIQICRYALVSNVQFSSLEKLATYHKAIHPLTNKLLFHKKFSFLNTRRKFSNGNISTGKKKSFVAAQLSASMCNKSTLASIARGAYIVLLCSPNECHYKYNI